MTRTSREKLNAAYLAGAVCLAGLIAAWAGNAWLFLLVAAGLVCAGLASGEIRPGRGRRRR